ncbi:NAD synthetase [Bacillus sp. TS-2]|nr:NAD synthetase [Bacillus sp. TS-2]
MLVNQEKIMADLHSKAKINAEEEIKARVRFLKDYVVKSGTNGFVLGISGGQDSTLAGKLTQMAVDELNEEQKEKTYQFFAMRLPYGEQLDEEDAQAALNFIKPSNQLTINIKPAVQASIASFSKATNEEMSLFVQGNTKARERMKAQYDVGAHYGCLVVGTDHAAEAVTGFFTKYGDGACDIAPLFGLTKRQGKELLIHLNAPEKLYLKAPTADLEDDKPGIPDEVALGLTYDQLDDYLEGKDVDKSIAIQIEKRYKMTEHKRNQPVILFDSWWK